jgi:rare lipoprotein A
MVVGKPFVIDGVTHTPADRMNYDAVGYAALGSEGGSAISAAHKTLPLPSYAEVTALDSGKTVLIRLERRGPMTNDQLVELSPGAAAQLGFSGSGKLPVRVRRVNPPEAERALLRSGERAPYRMETPRPLLGVLMRKLSPASLPSPGPVATATPAPVPTPTAKKPPKGKPVTQSTATPVHRPTPSASPSPAAKANADSGARKIGGQVIASGRMWRLRKGPFGSQAEAQVALAKVKGAGYKDARIQRAD